MLASAWQPSIWLWKDLVALSPPLLSPPSPLLLATVIQHHNTLKGKDIKQLKTDMEGESRAHPSTPHPLPQTLHSY